MAITVYKFTETSVEQQANMLQYILSHDADFLFSNVVLENNIITCYIGEYKILELGVAQGEFRCSVYIKEGNSTRRFRSYSNASAKVFKHFIKTSKGIMLSWLNYSSNGYYEKIWISKTNKNTTGLVILAQNDSTATSAYVGVADFDLSASGATLFSGKSMSSAEWKNWFGIQSYGFSSLSPVSLTQSANLPTSYLPYVYFFKQCQDTMDGLYKITIDGIDYFSDGKMAMRY